MRPGGRCVGCAWLGTSCMLLLQYKDLSSRSWKTLMFPIRSILALYLEWMCAVRGRERPEEGEANFEGRHLQRNVSCWAFIVREAQKLKFLRRQWAAAGNLLSDVKRIPGTRDRYASLRTWWGRTGQELGAIKRRGEAAIADLQTPQPSEPRRAREVPPAPEPEAEPVAVSSSSSSQQIQVTINVNVNTNAECSGARHGAKSSR